VLKKKEKRRQKKLQIYKFDLQMSILTILNYKHHYEKYSRASFKINL